MSEPGELSINLLLFRVGGVRFGCDADQASGIAACGGLPADGLSWFHEELAFGCPVDYQAPTVITIKSERVPSYRVVIDQLEQIAEFGCQQIRLLPALLEPFALRHGIWGIIPGDREPVLLVDFQLLLQKKHPADPHETEEGDSA